MHIDQVHNMPVSVGIPVFNEVDYIEKTVLSVVPQADEIIICDNCSTDGTSKICVDLAKKFNNIKYLRNQSNIGAYENFKLCLEKANNKYFMFLGGHDIIDKDYIATLKSALSGPGVIMAYGKPIHFDNEDHVISEYEYFFADDLMLDNKYLRLFSLIKNLHNCTMIHGLIPRIVMSHAISLVPPYIGFDHVVLSEILLLGKMCYAPSALYFRREVRARENIETVNKRHLDILRVPENDITEFRLQRMCEAQMRLIQPAGNATFRKAQRVLQMRFGYTLEVPQ